MIKFPKLFAKDEPDEILPLSSNESQSIAELHADLFHRGWDEDEFVSLLTQENVFGFYTRPITSPVMTGFVLARAVIDEAEILSIGTAKVQQRSGLGWRMMQATMTEARSRGACKMFLEVDEANLSARGLYKKIGFEQIGERQAYYRQEDLPKSNALVLQVELS